MVQVSRSLIGPTCLHRLTAIKVDLPVSTAHHRLASERLANVHIEIEEGIRSILILEDEMIVAMQMEDLVRELGIRDVHICADVPSALDLLQSTPVDCAILDLWLRDRNSMDVADLLAEKGIPFLFSSGSDSTALDDRHASRPLIGKPFLDDDLKLLILDTWALARSGGTLKRRDGHMSGTSGATH
jgi:CheY-like chemotaxis protein